MNATEIQIGILKKTYGGSSTIERDGRITRELKYAIGTSGYEVVVGSHGELGFDFFKTFAEAKQYADVQVRKLARQGYIAAIYVR